jgi:hypothetical protein
MSLLPRTNPLAACPVCGIVHPPGKAPCPDPTSKADPARPAPSSAGPQPPPLAGAEPVSAGQGPERASRRPLSDEKIRSFVDQGIVIDEDAHGLRLTGLPVRGRGKGTGQLSATDIVRLAADLGGGVLPADQRRQCPHCDAVVPRQAVRCEWCGKSLESPPS